jgi:hypothetical protein
MRIPKRLAITKGARLMTVGISFTGGSLKMKSYQLGERIT